MRRSAQQLIALDTMIVFASGNAGVADNGIAAEILFGTSVSKYVAGYPVVWRYVTLVSGTQSFALKKMISHLVPTRMAFLQALADWSSTRFLPIRRKR